MDSIKKSKVQSIADFDSFMKTIGFSDFILLSGLGSLTIFGSGSLVRTHSVGARVILDRVHFRSYFRYMKFVEVFLADMALLLRGSKKYLNSEHEAGFETVRDSRCYMNYDSKRQCR